MIEIDAAQGEGGGQILRTALSLSILTQTSVRLMNIRAKRPKPGLMRQHLACVRAAAVIGQAVVKGDELGSSDLYFYPSRVCGGEYEFAIGTAGSCALVLQTVLWPLLFADVPSRVTIDGGTHVGMAPSFEFLKWSFIPSLTKMGMNVEVSLGKHGFYPGGGGKLHANINHWLVRHPLDLQIRGEHLGQQALCLISNLDHNISAKQLSEVVSHLKWPEEDLKHQGLRNSHGIGNALMLSVKTAGHTEVASAYGDKTKSSEYVAQQACDEIKRYLRSDAAIGENLADQLLIPLALVGGKFSTNRVSEHLITNSTIIELFLCVKFDIQQINEHHHTVEIKLPYALKT